LVGLITGYIVGYFCNTNLENAFAIACLCQALILTRYIMIPGIDLDVNAFQAIIDDSEAEVFKPQRIWYLGVMFRTGRSFTSRGIIY